MRRLSFYLLTLCICIVPSCILAQENIVYNHYFFNPFLYNPSLITPNDQAELYIDYRRQWVGINDGPSTILANLQVPINYKMSLGATAIQDNVGVLQTTTGMLAFGYHVYFGNNIETGHKLGFGLSAGMSNNRIDMTKVTNPDDPAFGGNSTSSLTGQFGFHYQFQRLKAGFALPSLFKQTVTSAERFNKPGFTQTAATLTTLSYVFPLSRRVAFEPTAIYRTDKNLKQIEGMGVFKIDELLWAGGSYREGYGAAAFFRISVKHKIKIGYGYEFANTKSNGFNNASHEIQLVVNLGRKKTMPVTKIHPAEEEHHAVGTPIAEPVVEPVVVQEQKKVEEPVTTPAPEVKPKLTPEQELRKDMIPKKLNGEYLAPGYYIVVGVFHSSVNANKYYNTLKSAGYPANVGFYPPMDNYIIYMKKTDSMEEARVARDAYRARSRYSFRDTWIFFVK